MVTPVATTDDEQTPAPAPPEQVGATPAPGSGRPAVNTSLGRFAIAVIVVVGLLWLAWMVVSIATAPDVHVRFRDNDHGRNDSGGPGRLTDTPSSLT